VEVKWPEDLETVVMIEDAGNCEAACIGLEEGCLSWVEMLEDRCSSEGLLELLKGQFRFSSPFPFGRRL